ncbi:MAG TPA: metal-sulfur cluster assembly factor [Bacteroidia bacterium]|nr:metal-sulfur cluster assembly factor [Bacteroidia bacterium]MCC7515366.1 metal-sulfur cluster assembly factor [Bacteroidia bacterium]HNR47616.1 metal-sulfur cluster assembly factor [Bacteroidia bacterium]
MSTVTNNNIKCSMALAALMHVDDPEIGLNVVDLGLIYEIYFDETEKKIVCTQTLTTEFCPMGDSIVSNVTQALQQTFPEYFIEVNLTFEPPWSFESVSEEGRKFLGHY